MLTPDLSARLLNPDAYYSYDLTSAKAVYSDTSDIGIASSYLIKYLKRYSPTFPHPSQTVPVHKFKGSIEAFLNEKLHDTEDFCLSDDPSFERNNPMHVKLGKLYVRYKLCGNGLYELQIYSIDNNKRQKKLLFDFNNSPSCKDSHYPSFDFDKFLPFVIDTFNTVSRNLGDRRISQACSPIRSLLMQLAENKEVNGNEFKNAVRVFLEAVNTVNKEKGVIPATSSEIQDKFLKEKIQHVSDEITQIYYDELGITFDDIIKVMLNNGFNKSFPLTNQFLDNVFISNVDQNRYQLMMLIPAEVQSLESRTAIINTVNANFKLESTTFLACAGKGEKNENQIQNDRG